MNSEQWRQRKWMLVLRSTLTFFSFWFFLVLFFGFFIGCSTTPIREVTAGVQAREQAAGIDLFAEQKVKPAPIEIQTKKEILTKFSDCSAGLRACADELLQVSAKLDKAEKQISKSAVIKMRLVVTVIVLALVIVVYAGIRGFMLFYVRR